MSDPSDNPSGNGAKRSLFHVQGALLLVIVTTYCIILVLLALKRNPSFEAAFVAFALFAQSSVRRFFDWLNK